MGFRNREIEKKLIVRGATSLEKVASKAQKLFSFKVTDTLVGYSKDTYWEALPHMKADFVRLRYFADGSGQITVKHSDKGDRTDRVEIDVHVKEPRTARAFLTQILGKPRGHVRKRYFVYFLENEHTTVSVYKVDGDKRIFLEPEATSKHRLTRMINSLKKSLPWELEEAGGSLYDLFLR